MERFTADEDDDIDVSRLLCELIPVCSNCS